MIREMSSTKITVVISGTLDDCFFIQACYVAENLAKMLPNFHFKQICKNASEWESWLQEVCKKNEWSHAESPLIWKQIGITGNKVIYIGGTRQFQEILHEYYNINDDFKDSDLQALRLDALFAYSKQMKSSLEVHAKHRRITIIGAGRSMCLELVPQLITTDQLWLSHGVLVNLYDVPGHYFKLKKIIKDSEILGSGLYAATIIERLSEGLTDCDILLYLDHLRREENEETESWLTRNYVSMRKLANQINIYAPKRMKVIFCSMGPTCFCANVLQRLTNKLTKTNIVAISAHYGLEIVYPFIKSLNFNMQEFSCPPVWGFLGINKIVDICHMVQKCVAYPLNINKDKAFPRRKKHSVLRWFSYMAHDKDPYENYAHRKAITQYQVGRTEDFQKCKAICNLLKIWYKDMKEVDGDEIISLGISSNGTFGIPDGIFFSQPVYLKILDDQSRVWVPFVDFPLPIVPKGIFNNLILTAVHYVDICINQQC